MERRKITADGAFELLVAVSQQSNTKLIDVARRVVDTGLDPAPPNDRRGGGA
jgi:hypothetical protein